MLSRVNQLNGLSNALPSLISLGKKGKNSPQTIKKMLRTCIQQTSYISQN